MLYHYVYRISNIKSKRYYYGCRTSKILPLDDIGIKYFSSSSDYQFICDQKENPQNYKYKIVNQFFSRFEALNLEIRLHKKFNVGINESFINKRIQTSNFFDSTGIKQTKEHTDKIAKHNMGNKYRLGKKHSTKTKRIISEKAKGRIRTKESCDAQSISISKEGNHLYGKFGAEHPAYGRIITDKYRKDISDRTRGKIIGGLKICKHCQKELSAGNFKRWHGENCKYK